MTPLAILVAILLGLGAHAVVTHHTAQAFDQVAAASEPVPASSAASQATAAPPPRPVAFAVQDAPAPAKESLPPPVLPTHTAVLEFQPARRAFNQLKIGTELDLPESIRTVQQAANYLLAPTGYSLMVPVEGFHDAAAILNREVSPAARTAGMTTIESALLIVAGDDVRLVVDHVNKLVSFEPNT